MSDETTPQDDAAMSPASTGSVTRCRPIGAYVHTPTYEDLLDEVKRLRLTDAERKALSQIYDLLNERSRELQAARRIEESTPFVQLAKTVQQMWERLK